MAYDLLNEESAYHSVNSKVEMESIVSTLLHPSCKLRELTLEHGLAVNWSLYKAEVAGMIGKNLSEALQSPNCHLKTLKLQNIKLRSSDTKSLAEAIQSPNCNLKTLDLEGNRIGSEGMKSLAEALQSPNCHLESFGLTHDGIGSEGIKSLVEALQSPNCHLKTLYLEGNQIETEGIKGLAEALQSPNCQLKTLSLVRNWLEPEGAKSLSEALQSPNCHLESLSLGGNSDGLQGIKSLAEALQSPNCHLKTLDLQHNGIRSEDTKSLVEALQSPNCQLKSLDLQRNWMKSDDVKSLVKALESKNCHLMSLDLSHNNVEMSDVEALAEFLQSKSCRFEFLDLGNKEEHFKRNAITSQAELLLRQNKLRFTMPGPKHNDYEGYEGGWRTLVNALASKDCHVQALDITGHSLGDDDLSVFFQSLTTGSCQLKSLMLGPIGDLREIAKALQSPTCQLEHLTVVYSAGSKGGGDPILLADALQSYHCKLQTFSFIDYSHYESGSESGSEGSTELSGSGGSTKFIYRIADALKQQHCKLQNLKLKIKHTEDDEKQLLHALKFNYLCPLQQLYIDCDSPLIEKQFRDILNRNRKLHQSGLADHPQVQPTTAKLFICGFSGVGKTTLRKNLLKNMVLPKILQQHSSTTGMDLQTLQFGEKKLVLCDLAGQKEFHAFHHHFVRGSDKDIFLIVCKAPSREDNSRVVQFDNELEYWLRFIVSHRLSSKPKVLIVLNYFSPFFEDKTTDARGLTRNQIDKYNGLLDFGKSYIEDSVFGVVALNPKDLRLLKANIEVTLGDLLQQRPKIPLLCSRLLEKHLQQRPKIPLLCCQLPLERIAERNLPSFIRSEKTKIISYEEVVRSLLDDKRYTLDTISLDIISQALSHLHDMGELIYFIEIPDIVVVDAQWFVREVIGSFINTKLLGKPQEKKGHFHITHVRRNLLQICGLPIHADYILKCLSKMGVIFLPTNDDHVLVPALLEGRLYEYSGFKNISTNVHFRGRRYECKDKEHTLLPSGIFTKLQVRLQDICCNKSYHVGGGWIAFAIEDIHFCIKVGGHTDDWKDRQWIDIMIWFPMNAKKETVSSKYFAIQRCIFDVCTSDSSCPSISLEEHIMRFKFTKIPFDNARPLNTLVDNWQPIQVLDVEPLSKIKHELQVNGLSYMHTWNDSTSCKIVDLLFLEEISKYTCQLQVVEKKLRSLESEVDRLTRCQGSKGKIHLAGSVTDLCKHDMVIQKLDKLQEGQDKVLVKLDEVQERQEKLLEAINGLERSIEERSKVILKQAAKSIQLFKTDLPSLPYFTDEKNVIQKYSKLFGSNVKLHLLCEAREGPHKVENQEGISMTLPPDWLVSAAPLLAPAIICLTIAIKVATTVMAGSIIPQFLSGLVNILADDIPSIVGTILEQKLSADYIRTNKLSDNEMRIFLRKVTKGKRLNMKEFGLHRVMFLDNTFAWLCEQHAEHAQDGEILETYELDL